MTTNIEIRRAVLADIPAVAKVANDWIDATDWKPRSFAADVIEGFIRDALSNREIYVVGDPIHAYLSFDPVGGKIGALYCANTGIGVGKALLEHVRQGRDYLWLTTDEPNTRAQAFYLREGFVQTGEQPGDTPDEPVELVMEWRG
jgi:hypothetical protein